MPVTFINALNFIHQHSTELWIKLAEQIYLVGIAMAIAIILGIPLGIIAVRNKHLQSFILGLVGILQTIPSLALLAFLLPFLGIGAKPAIIALSLYAFLPIVRNTVTGIETIPPATIEAANGLGFTPFQRLRLVELPLAMPLIIAGVRVAAIMSMGIATLAAFIGAGGLGDFINRGLALNSTGYLLLGAIPAAILALVLDFLIGQIEHAFNKQKNLNRPKFIVAVCLLAVLFIFPIYSIFIAKYLPDRSADTIRIGTKNFTEQFILGEMLAQLIENDTKLHVERDFNLGTTDILQQALTSGQIDIYPEYTGTAYLTVLHLPYSGQAPQTIYQRTKDNYLKLYHIVWLKPFGFNNTQSLGVRETFADQNHLITISDLLPLQNRLILGAPTEFLQRADGMPGMYLTYHLNFAKIIELETGLMYDAISNNQVNVIVAFSTDGRIPANKILILKDDKKLFPPYDCAPIIREATLKAHPELVGVINQLAGIIDDKTMQQLNAEVDLQKTSPAQVAHAFLVKKGLLAT